MPQGLKPRVDFAWWVAGTKVPAYQSRPANFQPASCGLHVSALPIPAYQSRPTSPGLPIPAYQSRPTNPGLPIPAYQSRPTCPGLPVAVYTFPLCRFRPTNPVLEVAAGVWFERLSRRGRRTNLTGPSSSPCEIYLAWAGSCTFTCTVASTLALWAVLAAGAAASVS